MDLTNLLSSIGSEVEDAEEESFLLFAQDIPSANLGFVDSRATTVDVTIHGYDYSIYQSPTLLSSSRAGGTTGAVLWKITPLLAEWISNTATNPLWAHDVLSSSSTVVELGCGISGLVAMALSPAVAHYIATDQEYVHRLFRQNLEANMHANKISSGGGGSSRGKSKGGKSGQSKKRAGGGGGGGRGGSENTNITFTSLDWELDAPGTLKEMIPSDEQEDAKEEEEEDKGFDLLISCDCIYNDSLIPPLVRTCAEICRLRPVYGSEEVSRTGRTPTVCIIAQQQRSPEVFEAWLTETMRVFRVWRVGGEELGGALGLGTGYVVHLLLLKEGH